MPKHIVIADGAWGGHHAMYLKTIGRILSEEGHQVTALCPSPNEMADYSAYYFSNDDVWMPPSILKRFFPPIECLSRWLHLSRTLRKVSASGSKPDLVLIAWLDIFLCSRAIPAWLVDIMFPHKWSGIYFHPRYHRIMKQRRKPLDLEGLVRKSRFACSLAVLDAGVNDKMQLGDKPVFVMPDFSDELPADEKFSLAEEIRNKAGGRKIIALLGGLSRRKGLLTLLEIAKHAITKKYYFVFAGRLVEQTFSRSEQDEVRAFFAAPASNCFVYDDSIETDGQFNALVNVCDVVFAMYQDFPHSSNLVTKAASFGKNLLVSTGGYMEEVVTQYNLGEAVPENDVQGAISALSRLTLDDALHSRSEGMQAYASSQSQVVLRKVLNDLVQQGTEGVQP